jgi:sucrose-phosphate synthase
VNNENDKLYILLVSVHGLIRGQDLELGRDADTGGQTKYVVELLRELSKHPDVEHGQQIL